MQLPEDFVRLMHEQYDTSTADALCQALCETEPEVSIRLNLRKGLPLNLDKVQADPVPWCPDAYYLAERPAFTFDPLLHAGAYYVQEASSMYIAELVRKYLLQNSKFKIQNSNGQQPKFTPLGERGGGSYRCFGPLCCAWWQEYSFGWFVA